MDALIMAGQLILALTILVFIHELGHFLAAKAFGIRVEKFYIFFDAGGKKLFSATRGETEYGIGWLPLGGYVKIAGMIDESMDKEQMKKPPEPWEFRSKPNWQKFIVMVAGVVMNVLLGIFLYAMYLNVYVKDYLPVSELNKDGIYAYQTARDFGFQTGDKLIAINGKKFERFEDYVSLKVFFGADVTVERNGKMVDVKVPGDFFKSLKDGRLKFIEVANTVSVDSILPESNAQNAGIDQGDKFLALNGNKLFGFGDFYETLQANKNDTITATVERDGASRNMKVLVDSSGRLGFVPDVNSKDYELQEYTLSKSLGFGTKDAWGFMYYNAVGLGKIFQGEVNASESVQSPIGIATIYGATWEWPKFWRLTAILSMVLAFMNLLPIPALDGGHIMFIAIETVIGRKLSDTFLERAQIVGMVLILALMVFAFGNDIFKLFKG